MYKLLLVLLLLSGSLSAQSFKPVDDSSSVAFKIKNFGVGISGTFTGLSGAIVFDPAKLGSCSFVVSVKSATVNTGIDMRDTHLKKDDFFDVDKFPTLTFTSTRVTPSTKAGFLFLFGNLEIRGVSKPVSFPFQAVPNGSGYTFTGSFTINRRDFGVGGSSISMSDEVKIDLKIVAFPEN
jgi:polyisoprenoid-binding protein YceI